MLAVSAWLVQWLRLRPSGDGQRSGPRSGRDGSQAACRECSYCECLVEALPVFMGSCLWQARIVAAQDVGTYPPPHRPPVRLPMMAGHVAYPHATPLIL